MKSSRVVAGMALCGLAIAGAFWAWPEAEPVGRPANAEEADPAEVVVEARLGMVGHPPVPDQAGSRSTQQSLQSPLGKAPPLPAFDTPFKDSFDALLEATLAGDSEAACRLVGEAR